MRVVELGIGSAAAGGGEAVDGSVAVEVVELVVEPSGVCTVVEVAAGVPGCAPVVVVLDVVCASAANGSAEMAIAQAAIRMMNILLVTRALMGTLLL